MSSSHPRRMAAALCLLAATACAGSGARRGIQATPQAAPLPAKAVTEADVQFMNGMIGHHAQAIVMARMAATHGASASIQTLSGRVMNAQKDEIKLMQMWLRDHGRTAPQPDTLTGAMPGMSGMSHEGMSHPSAGSGQAHAMMPGMLTPEQMQQLDAARGAEFDRLFLTFMIQHHKGAVEMVKTLIGTTGAAQDDTVFKLASDINVDQTTEIARMQQMLAGILFGS